MRTQRLGLIFAALYLIFIGGAVYYDLIFAVRVFHHVLMTVLLGVWLLARLRTDGLPRTPITVPLLLGVCVWFISAWFGVDRRMALEDVWFLIVHLILFFVLVDLFQRGRGKWVMEAQFFIGTMIVMISAVELASWYFGLAIGGASAGWVDVRLIPLELPPRLAWALNSTNWLAGYVAPLILLTGGWAYTLRRQDFRRVLWGLTGALLLVLIFTFTRGGYMSFAAGLGTLTLMRLAQVDNLRERLTPRTLAAVGLVVGAIAFTAVFVVMVSQVRGRSSGDQVRLDLYRSAVEMTVDNPALGVGPGGFGRALRSYRDPELARDRMGAAHNAYLGIASEGGLIALAGVAWIGLLLLQTWWRNWRNEPNWQRRLRLEVTIAALIGIGVHSMVDIFNRTPNVLMISLLVAYSITGHKSVLDDRPQGLRWPAAVGLVILAGYALWFTQLNQAYSSYADSLRGNSIAAAQSAADRDPNLNLYPLQVAHIMGQEAYERNRSLDEAIAAYERVLDLEPTWDVGWLNLAALYELDGDLETAFTHVQTAYAINPLTPSALHLARLGEETGLLPEDDVINLYETVMIRQSPPRSPFWQATDLRRDVLAQTVPDLRLDHQYRAYIAYDNPDAAAALVPEDPQTAAAYWVVGEHALTVTGDAESAETYFSDAIDQNPRNGDYYVSRARARVALGDITGAEADLMLADLLGTALEYPNYIRAQMADTPTERNDLLRISLPGRGVNYSFSAVLYGGRISGFDLLPPMRDPGPGRDALEPWYLLAQNYLLNGRTEDARDVYEAILDLAPYEVEARERLDNLS